MARKQKTELGRAAISILANIRSDFAAAEAGCAREAARLRHQGREEEAIEEERYAGGYREILAFLPDV
jgi:hypothetical protein